MERHKTWLRCEPALEWSNPTHKHFALTFPMLVPVLGQADPTMPGPCCSLGHARPLGTGGSLASDTLSWCDPKEQCPLSILLPSIRVSVPQYMAKVWL